MKAVDAKDPVVDFTLKREEGLLPLMVLQSMKELSLSLKPLKMVPGVPAVAQRNRWHLGSAGTQVRSLAQHVA